MKTIIVALVVALGMSACTTRISDTNTSDSAEQTQKPAPEFDLENVAGGRMKSGEIKGKVAVIDFWATWCAPCIQEIPNFNALHETYGGKGVQMLAITIMSGGVEDIQPRAAEFGIKYPVLAGDDHVEEGFGGIIGFPTTFVVTPDWKIYKKYLGMTDHKKERIEADIQKLLGE
jgi:thiol-disulfide isomerase/thioredoxin